MSHFSYNQTRLSYDREGEREKPRPSRITSRTTATSSFRRRVLGQDEPRVLGLDEPLEVHTPVERSPIPISSPASRRRPTSFEELAVSRSKPIRWKERNIDRDDLVSRLISPPSSTASSEVGEPSAATSFPPSSPPWNAATQYPDENTSDEIQIMRRTEHPEISPPDSPKLPTMRPESPDSPDSKYYSSPSDRSSLRTPAFAEFVKVMTAHTPKHVLERPPMDFDITPFQKAGWFPKGHRYHPESPQRNEDMVSGSSEGNADVAAWGEDDGFGGGDVKESVKRPVDQSPEYSPSKKARTEEEPYFLESENMKPEVDGFVSSRTSGGRYQNSKQNVEDIPTSTENRPTSGASQGKQYKSREQDILKDRNSEDLPYTRRNGETRQVSKNLRFEPDTQENNGQLSNKHIDAPTKKTESKRVSWGEKSKRPPPPTEETITPSMEAPTLATQSERQSHVGKGHLESFQEFVERATAITTINEENTLIENPISKEEKRLPFSKEKVYKDTTPNKTYLETMDARLTQGLTHIKDAKRGMDQLNYTISHLPSPSTTIPLSTSTNLILPLPRFYSLNPFKFTNLGFILFIITIWYIMESLMCGFFCHPRDSVDPVWSVDDPFFPWALPVKLDQWTGGVVGRVWGWWEGEGVGVGRLGRRVLYY